ncbi:cytochrome b/b6 domain-containing protein [Candidatus Woesearchaeota archaeon]|nr:cytochrome b/b6 domain-containing protein [Candidatus Woesearchaeota archaeon]
MRNIKKIQAVVHWLLLVAIVMYIITGFGITQYRIVEALTFGLLSKPLSFEIHNNLIIPFIVLLVLHIYLKFKKSK